MGTHFDELKNRLTTISNINKAGAVLAWDQQTYMPPGGTRGRGEQLATLGQTAHELFTADETGALLEAARAEVLPLGEGSDEAAIVRVTQRDFERLRRVPSDLVGKLRRHATESRAVWVEARQNDDFESFAPYLERTVDLNQELAEAYGYQDRPYDALLEPSEPGITTRDLEHIFGELRQEQVPLIRAIAAKRDVDDSVLHQPFDEVAQERFARVVIERYGYDFRRGRLDRTIHPFEISLGIDDVRLTTRYDANFLSMSLFGTMHESGHGMYEQGIGRALEGTPLARGASGGLHESQSRLWENLVGRSRDFWEAFYRDLQTLFTAQLGTVTLETFYKAINKVYPSVIRVEADEMTYNMHIMLRFELENELLEGRLRVQEAPDAWRERMNDYLGVVPANDTDGILQDTHWSSSLGSFPSYALGNVFGAQLWERALEDRPDIPDQIRHGEFGALHSWLQDNVYQHGRKYEPKDLIERVTGSPISTEPYIRYLRKKFGEIYGDLG